MSSGSKPKRPTGAQLLGDWVAYLIEVFEDAVPYLRGLVQTNAKARLLIAEFASRSKSADFWREALTELPKEAAGNLFFAFTLLPELGQKLSQIGNLSDEEQGKILKDMSTVLESLKAARTGFR